ncbi:extracellular solute-binding protein [Pseudooceanicola sediminis]|uniref:Extracellular solute-binding protein n=2 Tax=Pseudooceanicola sediminis TaxID=2211117 RepID=A0A399J5F9_9RHOB|nr:extracellular solute-binding protein [Puniceibacterium sp. HSS470]RII39192.1 extracellular solute-binding protein [Pseudooceanicola sediminis]|tara:strand:+ start:46585 stop:47613 length:1029 start_codon:yes stop_codon:yes gene_type:complete
MVLAALVAPTGPARAQEAVAQYVGGGAAPLRPLLVRSTTDIAILAPALEAFVARTPGISLRYEQWGSNALYDISLAGCEGQTGAADVVFSSGVHQMVDLVNRACASPYASPVTEALPAARRWRNELWGITHEPAVIIYNTALVPAADAPRTRFGLLDLMRRPSSPYRGKIATYDIETSGLGYLFAFMDSLEATTFGGLLEGFARTEAIATCCSNEIIEGVAEGRYLIAYNVLGSYVASGHGPNIGVIQPEDYTFFLSRALMIPKGAAQKDAAAALLEFLLSPDGQAILAQNSLVQRLDGDVSSLSESAQRPIAIDPKLLVAMDAHRRQRFVTQWRATFGTSP